jgi:WD40 repeat protein
VGADERPTMGRSHAPAGRPFKLRNYVRSIAWSPDGKTLAISGGSDRGLSLWDVDSGELRSAPLPTSNECRALAWSLDGQSLAAGDGAESRPGQASVRFWKPDGSPKGSALTHPLGVTSLAFSPDGGRLLTGCDDSTVRVWDVGTERLLREPIHHSDRVFAVAFTPDGLQYMTGCDEVWCDSGTRRPIRSRGRQYVITTRFAGWLSALTADGWPPLPSTARYGCGNSVGGCPVQSIPPIPQPCGRSVINGPLLRLGHRVSREPNSAPTVRVSS